MSLLPSYGIVWEANFLGRKMEQPSPPRRVVSFGIYQCDLYARELHKNGIRVKLSDQPFRLLAVLLERPGEVVTRQELRERLWPDHAYGDFDDGLNTAINKIRAALDDEAENPRFVETLPRRGYRFISPVDVLDRGDAAFPSAIDHAPSTVEEAPAIARLTNARRGRNSWKGWALFGATAVVLVAAAATWLLRQRPALSFNSRDSVLVADFENET